MSGNGTSASLSQSVVGSSELVANNKMVFRIK